MNIPKINSKKWKVGPGLIVTAAFIGPGTVTMCTISGANYGMGLLWVILLAVVGTYTLQEMSARLGIVTQSGLASLVRSELKKPLLITLSMTLIILAIGVGNAAYEGGNIAGAVLGISSFGVGQHVGVLVIGVIAFLILWVGKYQWIEKILIAMVALMSLTFIVATFLSKPDIKEILLGIIPRMESARTSDILALIGTTIVPYNLFLHASIAQKEWKKGDDLKSQKRDSFIAIALGGLVSACIIIVSSQVSTGHPIENIMDLSRGLEQTIGPSARWLLSLGLLAAGLTSAITAPLAAAYVLADCLKWGASMKNLRFRLTWMMILLTGVVVALSGYQPIEVIKLAQISNAILLPLVAGMIVWLSWKKEILGVYKNTRMQTFFGIVMILITLLMTLRLFWS